MTSAQKMEQGQKYYKFADKNYINFADRVRLEWGVKIQNLCGHQIWKTP